MRLAKRHLVLPLAAAVVAAGSVAAFASGVAQTSVPAIVPATTATPNVADGEVETIVKIGNKVILGGNFTSATNHGAGNQLPRANILAFDATTGFIDAAFAPTVDGEVMALEPGPTANTVYIAGAFSTVNGNTAHKKVALLNTTDGSLVNTFDVQGITSAVTDLARVGSRLYLGGNFTTVAGVAHAGLASVNATTGALDPYMNLQLEGHHNWTTGSTGALAATGTQRFDVSPDGTKLAVVGDFKTVSGTDHDQVLLVDLSGPTSAAIANWQTDRFDDRCASGAFDSWVRDVSFAPDGSYFVVASTGAGFAGTLCDSATRWESSATGSALQPTWIDYTGGDTLHSVTVTGAAIYVGGHQRWMNNSLGRDQARAGAIGRAGIAALDPVSGLPLAWNPGRNPRGNGARALYATTDGLYIGSDTNYIGNFDYFQGKIAFMPLAGGYTPAATTITGLPGNVYFPKTVALPVTLFRVNVGGPTVAATDGGIPWAADTASLSPYRVTGGGATIANSATNVTKTSGLPANTPLALFNSQRRDSPNPPDMQWNFPAPAGAHLRVRLYFAERLIPAPAAGTRVMDVRIDNKLVSANLDIVAANTADTATVREYEFTSDGNVDIDFSAIIGQPMLSAIEVINVSAGSATGLGRRTFNGTTAGALVDAGTADGTDWFDAKGAFMVGNQLFYLLNTDANLYKRSFDSTTSTFGAQTLVNPYSDPHWDSVGTGSGTTTYAGVKSDFYAEIPTLTSLWYENGKLYYTINGQQSLFWRWFTPDSGAIGADKFTVAGSTGFNTVSGLMFSSGGQLYFAKTDGNLYRVGWVNGAPSGAATVVNGPGTGGIAWNTNAGFLIGS